MLYTSITDAQTITTVAGGLPYTGDVILDTLGQIFVFSTLGNPRIVYVNSSGIMLTKAGTGISGYSGDGGPATLAKITPTRICFDNNQNLLIADYYNNRLRRVDASSGNIITIGGTGAYGFSGDGLPATLGMMTPSSLCVDTENNIYFVDSIGAKVRRISSAGILNTIAGNCAVVAGGVENTAAGINSIVVGGCANYALNIASFVGSGAFNNATGVGSTVVSGYCNLASGPVSFIGSGADATGVFPVNNTASGTYSAIVSGQYNVASGRLSFIGNGGGFFGGTSPVSFGNNALSDFSFIGNGYNNRVQANSQYGTVVNGKCNDINGCSIHSFVGSGCCNVIANSSSGYCNAPFSFIGGGLCNIIDTGNTVGLDTCSAFIGNGTCNTICAGACYSSIIGGLCNTVSGMCSGVFGGCNNLVTHDFAFAAGCNLLSVCNNALHVNNMVMQNIIMGFLIGGVPNPPAGPSGMLWYFPDTYGNNVAYVK